MIKLCFSQCLSLFLFALAIGALISVGIFAIDVIKWHEKETKVKIEPSNDVKKIVSDILAESEVKENERDVTEPGEYNSSPFFGTWSEP